MKPEHDLVELRNQVAKRRSRLTELNDLGEIIKIAADDDNTLENALVTGVFPAAEFADFTFSGVIFAACTFQEANFKSAVFRNCIWLDSEFSNGNFNESFWTDCRIAATKGIGADFFEARIAKMTIDFSEFSYANFTKARLQRITARHTNFSDSVFAESQFKEFMPEESRFTRADFFKTPLAGIDFSSCEIDGIQLTQNSPELRGVIVNIAQAAELARKMGVIIR